MEPNRKYYDSSAKLSNNYTFENPISEYITNKNTGIERVIICEDFTRVDFVYISSHELDKGGYISIENDCFIRIGSNTKYNLIEAINIPISPLKYFFKEKGQVHHFSLIFQAIPKNVKRMHIIEKLVKGQYLNFFNVLLVHDDLKFIRTISNN